MEQRVISILDDFWHKLSALSTLRFSSYMALERPFTRSKMDFPSRKLLHSLLCCGFFIINVFIRWVESAKGSGSTP